MCGIVGHLSPQQAIDEATFVAVRDTLTHRGPDDAGTYFNQNRTIALGHRRLSFLDLGTGGHQPMPSANGKVHITFNGEIYNFKELRLELEKLGYNFQSNSDTEVIIIGYQHWGKDVVNHLKGMFAFGIVDLEKQKLFLARDHFGIKPLYYWSDGNHFLFASELKALIRSGLPAKEIDITSFADYFVYRYIPSPKTIWENIFKVPPAHYLLVDINTLEQTLTEYWRPETHEVKRGEERLVPLVDEALLRSVDIHRRAEVPVGSFLSGGYDSSALVYYLTRLNSKPDTFSIGFSGWDNSEHLHAKIVADHLSVPNSAVIADEKDLELLSIMPEVYDEPIADISIIPTYMVSRLARTKVKAVLSGEGADELFCGYTWQKEFYESLHPNDLSSKIKLIWKKPDTVAFYANAMAMGRFDGEQLREMLAPEHRASVATDVDWFYRQQKDHKKATLKTIQWMDMKCFMGELVLTKVDRASMANSLEVRVPFLDHELFELMLSTSEDNYYHNDATKYLLYENLKEHLPDSIMRRRKQGFVGPDSYYMNITWYKNQLAKSSLVDAGLILRTYIEKLLTNEDHWRLWKILVMENWYRHWMA